MQLDFSSDPRVWDNVETLTYQSTRRGNLLDTLPGCLRLALTNKELAESGGVYTGLDLAFLIPASALSPGFVPKPADVITDAGNTAYTVLQALGQCRDANGFQAWKTICRDPIIAYDLQDTIAIERATFSYDASGAVIKTFPPAGGLVVYASLPARVQQLAEDIKDERLVEGFEGSHAVYVARQLPDLSPEDRIRWTPRGSIATYYLEIVRYHNAQRIDQLPVIEAMLRP